MHASRDTDQGIVVNKLTSNEAEILPLVEESEGNQWTTMSRKRARCLAVALWREQQIY